MSTKYPTSSRGVCYTSTHQCGYLVLTCTGSSINVIGAVSGVKQVYVGIDKARENRFATQVYYVCMLPTHAQHFIVGSHR